MRAAPSTQASNAGSKVRLATGKVNSPTYDDRLQSLRMENSP